MKISEIGLWGLIVLTMPTLEARAANKSPPNEVQAFAEPFRTVEVAALEAGLLTEVLVEEGVSVEKNQPLAELHKDVLKATLEIARSQRDATGALTGAAAELRLRELTWQKFKELRKTDHSSDEETRRAESEYEVAQSRVLQAREQIEVRKLEFLKAELLLAQRTIRAPMAGVVTQVHKDAGEFLSPSDPVVVTIVQLDPLTVSFSVPVAHVSLISHGQKHPLRIEGLKQPRYAEVELVSSIIDAESQTVHVKFKLPNPDKDLRSGVKCFLPLGDPSSRLAEQSELKPGITKVRN